MILRIFLLSPIEIEEKNLSNADISGCRVDSLGGWLSTASVGPYRHELTCLKGNLPTLLVRCGLFFLNLLV